MRAAAKKCFTVEVPLDLDVEKAVCNHGFFMMAPNVWFPKTKTLQRPLRLSDSRKSVTVSISNSLAFDGIVRVRVDGVQVLSPADEEAISAQVRRMLRSTPREDASIKEFQEIHPMAKQTGFGRLFRSPSLFEDAVKSILLCCCGWKKTLEMAEDLCKLQWELYQEDSRKKKKRKRSSSSSSDEQVLVRGFPASAVVGNFPNAKELARLDPDYLQTKCTSLGYRAKTIVMLANKVVNATLHLPNDDEEYFNNHPDRVASFYQTVLKLDGFGHFVCSNIMMCIGVYHYLPIDSETSRHVKLTYPTEKCVNPQRDIKKIYDKYAPFQTLAYWLELSQSYESKVGKLSELPKSAYSTVTGSLFSTKTT